MSSADGRPLFVWDGDCGFCRFWMLRWKSRVGDAVEVGPYQKVGDRVPGMDEADFRRSAKLVEEDGTVHEAAAAVFRLLAVASGVGVWWWLYRRLPPFRWLSEAAYRFVARHRSGLGRITGLLWGRQPPPHDFRVGGWLLLRALALVYLLAFASLGVQIAGLAGPEGILPVDVYLRDVANQAGGGPTAWHRAPTLAWLAGGGAALELMALAGAGAALSLFLGFRPLISAAAAWVLYLSLVVAGQRFMAYQWDLLLVESGFLALFLAPVGSPGPDDGKRSFLGRRFFRAPRLWFPALWLVWWLLFRLILESGLVKLTGGDPVWRDLTALAHHYETQPLPNPVAWFAHQLPMVAHRVSTAVTLAVELAVPLLFFLPRRPRVAGALAVAAHQILILATGNYTFFNLLTIALALCLLDDAHWRGWAGRNPGVDGLLDAVGAGSGDLRSRLASIGAADAGDGPPAAKASGGGEGPVPGPLRRALVAVFGVAALILGSYQLLGTGGFRTMPGPVNALRGAVAPFGLINRYGLFADMTTRRPEIVLEGRRGDGPWERLEFRYKPDDPDRAPSQVAPHHPRVDWQMWFSALKADRVPAQAPARMRYDRWFLQFVARLLDGQPDVWAFMAPEGPFREGGDVVPPDRIRALLYEYRFTGWEEWRSSGRWWSRTRIGTYLDPVRRTGEGLEVVGGG